MNNKQRSDHKETKTSSGKRIKKRWILLFIVAIIAAIMIMIASLYSVLTTGRIFGAYGLRPESTYLIAILLILLPILLLTIFLFVVFGKNKPKTITADIVLEGAVETSQKSEREANDPKERDERFCMLSEIDRNKSMYSRVSYDRGIDLERLCENFRNYAASRLRLYYDIEDIRRFIAGMSVSHILILQGMSGTGKTSLAHAFGSFIDNSSTVIPVQPMWKERTDLVGYYNEFTKRFNETLLLEKMYEANYSKDIYVTVLDEMNIARVEYYFAEFLSLLELPNPEERYLDVVSDKWSTDPKELKDGRIKLPVNMWFIGTANNDDSTFAISDKVYDRAMILDLDSKSERFAAPMTGKIRISAEQFEELVSNALKEYEISKRNRNRLEELDKYLIEHFHITFGNRIMKQILTYIPVYIACGGDELDALDDILSKKVMRKLETQNPIYLRNSAEGLIAYMDELFGADKMTLCKEHIRRIERNA